MSAIRSRGRRGHTIVPNWRWEDPDLDCFELCIAGWLASHADGFIEEYVTGNEVARRTHISRERAQRALKHLEEMGIIETAYGEPRHRLVITFDWVVWEGPRLAVSQPVTGADTASHRLPHSQTTGSHLSIGETQGEEQTEGAVARLQDTVFDVFYAAYPNKVGKPAAHRAFKAAMTKEKFFPGNVMVGLMRWKHHWAEMKTETRFIPHPATWLNQERWKDECPKGAPQITAPRERARAALEQLARRDDELS